MIRRRPSDPTPRTAYGKTTISGRKKKPQKVSKPKPNKPKTGGQTDTQIPVKKNGSPRNAAPVPKPKPKRSIASKTASKKPVPKDKPKKKPAAAKKGPMKIIPRGVRKTTNVRAAKKVQKTRGAR